MACATLAIHGRIRPARQKEFFATLKGAIPNPMPDWQEWNEIHGTPIEPDHAWRLFADWKSRRKEIGLRFISPPSRLAAFGTLLAASNGTIQFQAETARATFDLTQARFTFGPP